MSELWEKARSCVSDNAQFPASSHQPFRSPYSPPAHLLHPPMYTPTENPREAALLRHSVAETWARELVGGQRGQMSQRRL